MKHPRFILASASPRRRQLLADAGYHFEVITSGVDEDAIDITGLDPSGAAVKLALAKARAVADKHPGVLVLGCDTVVDLDGQIIGKAQNDAHALRIITELFSRPHKVITALAFVHIEKGIEKTLSDSTTVYPRKLTEAQVEAHIKSGAWKGKAGAYGLQEVNDSFVERIEGSFTNVVGLPLELLEKKLAELGCNKSS